VASSLRRRLALVAAIALTVGGCTVRTAYHFLDSALLWSLGDYIDWQGDQKDTARALIREFHQWHRYSELPRYAREVRALAGDLAGPVDRHTVDRHAQALTAAWRGFMQQLAEPAADLFSELSTAQIDSLLATLAERERKDRRDALRQTPAEVRQQRYGVMAKGTERLVGSLTAEQRALISAWTAALQDLEQQSLDHRAAWREHFAEVLRDRDGPPPLQTRLRPLFSEPDLLWSEAYRRSLEYNEGLTHQLLVDLANSMTAKQRRKATQRLYRLAADFEALGQSPPASFTATRDAAASL